MTPATNATSGNGGAPRAAGGRTSDECLWTVHDVAAFLQASTSWVYKASGAGTLPCVRVGAMLRFDPACIRAWALGNNARGAHTAGG
jgi:hypothetical protein